MMNKEEKYRIARIRGRKTGGYSMLELPYKGDRIVMLILLPDTGFYGTTLEEMEQKLDFHNIEKSFPKNRDIDKIKLELPKFKIESEIPLKDVLMNLGITDMFGEGADLTGIDPSGKLYVSEVKQKAFIEVHWYVINYTPYHFREMLQFEKQKYIIIPDNYVGIRKAWVNITGNIMQIDHNNVIVQCSVSDISDINFKSQGSQVGQYLLTRVSNTELLHFLLSENTMYVFLWKAL